MHSFNTIDIVTIGILILGFVLMLFIKRKRSNGAESFFFGGKSSNWITIGVSMFVVGMSSSSLAGQAGDAYATGIAAFNYSFVSVLVMIVVAWVFLPLYIRAGIYTMPQLFEKRFDARSMYYFSAISIVVALFLDASVVFYAGLMFAKVMFPAVQEQWLVVAIVLLVAVYAIPKGVSQGVVSDKYIGYVLLAGSAVMTYFMITKGGGEYVAELMREGSKAMRLVRPIDDSSVPWLGMIVGIPILGLFFWGNNQVIVQRALMAKSVDQAQKGILFVGLLTLITLFVVTIPGVMAHKFMPELPRVDMVYPAIIMNLLPSGVAGLMVCAFAAGVIAAISGILNSAATLLTMDFYCRAGRRSISDRHMRLFGQIMVGVMLLVVAMWAPNIGTKFSTLLKYYQQMLSMLVTPVVALCIVGVFSRRANGNGAFYGLLIGTLPGVVDLLLKMLFGISLFGKLHFLLTIPLYFSWTIVAILVISRFNSAPDPAKIEPYMWSKELFRAESVMLKTLPFYKNYRVLSLVLILLCAVIFVVFG